MGTGKYTPNLAVAGDMGWEPTFSRQLKCEVNLCCRFSKMLDRRINKMVYNLCKHLSGMHCKNWYFTVNELFKRYHCSEYIDVENVHLYKKTLLEKLQVNYFNQYLDNWIESLHGLYSSHGSGSNKLRTYRNFKFDFETENYIKVLLPYKHRSELAIFRCGVAPIRLETGRYERLAVNDRKCPLCNTDVENEIHVLLKCPQYVDIRQNLLDKAMYINNGFPLLNDVSKLNFYIPERVYYVIPPGVRLSVCPAVRTSVRPLAIWFPEQNLSSIWPTTFKLHRMIVHIG
jgi:hypothetical protein